MELLEEPLFWKIALALIALLCFVVGFRRLRRARLIDDTPTSRVRSAAQGYVELSGRAQLPTGAQLAAPLSGRPCVWWLFRIERKRQSGKGTRWETINRGVSEVPFLLADETGSCLVNPLGAEVFPSEKATWYGSTPWPANTGTNGLLLDRMLSDYRYTEHRIYEHEHVDVIGEFSTVGGVAGVDVEAHVAELLREWKNNQSGLLRRFDANRDGVLSQGEWERARCAARVAVETKERGAVPQSYCLMARPGDDRPFLLAACDLGLVARRYRWQGAGSLLTFVAAIVVLATWLIDGA